MTLLIKFILININLINSFKLIRRDFLYATGLTPSISNLDNLDNFSNFNNRIFNLSPTFNNLENSDTDKYAHWSIYGLVPPPIEKIIVYEELIDYINNNSIFSIQPAFWDNCIIATTNEGHRLTLSISDDDYNDLFINILKIDKNIHILPIDPVRSKIRDTTFSIFYPSLLFYILSELDIIPYQFEFYNSIKERDQYNNRGKKPDKIIKKINKFIKNITKKII